MMIRWMLLRHAKSDWADSSLEDKERPLNPRGKKAAWSMGQKLAQNDLIPERILCSTALRSVQTLQGIQQTLSQYSQRGVPEIVPEILFFDELYLANPETIVRVAQSNHGGRSHLIVFEKQTETQSETLADWGNASEMYKGWKMAENLRGEGEGGQER
jgi:phosphohistidine phosphatase